MCPPGSRAGNQSPAADMFPRVADRSPVRRTVKGAGLGSHHYTILDFIRRRRELNRAVTHS